MTERPLRADAARNRQRLIEIATRAFACDGPNTSLEDVARTAGVGVGTLYRHFPTREALYVAVHRSEIKQLARRADDLLASDPPLVALQRWMTEFVDFFEAKKGMADVFRAVMANGDNPFVDLRVLTYQAATRLLAAAASAGGIREDVDADDLIVAIHGISLSAVNSEQTRRLAQLLFDGLIYRGSPDSSASRSRRDS